MNDIFFVGKTKVMRDYKRIKVVDIVYLGLVALLIVMWSKHYAYYAVSDFRPGVLAKLLDDIKSGVTPEFLSQVEHSYGFAFYLPYIAYFLHIEDMKTFMIGIQLFFSATVVITMSIMMYKATYSRLILYLTPVLLHIFCGNFLYGFLSENYWAGGYAVILGIPLLYFYFTADKLTRKYILTVVIGLLCSIFNVFRNHMSFSVLVAFYVICLYEIINKNVKGGEKAHVLIRMVLFWVLYYLISDYIPLIVGVMLNRKLLNNEQFMWHAVLCGLGVFENKYGLAWDDKVIREIVDAKYGCGVDYTDNNYWLSCKLYFFELFKEDPIFVLGTWMKKFFICMGRAFKALVIPYKGSINIKMNFDSPLVPIVAEFITGVVLIKKKIIKKEEIKEAVKCSIFLIFIACAGTIQAIIGYLDVRYYFATYVTLSSVFFFGAIALIDVYNKEKWHI